MATIPVIPGVQIATGGILNKPIKDIICALLFGGLNNMLKGPLICVQADLDKLIGEYTDLPTLKDLKAELISLKGDLKAFEESMGIKDMLSRVNGAIAEVQNLLALDGLCKIPLKAPAIPDVLSQVIDAEFAQANAILNDLGRLAKPQLCLNGNGGLSTGAYNPNSILGSIDGHIKKMGKIPDSAATNLTNRLKGVRTALDKSINRQLFPDFRHKHNLLTGAPYAGEASVITLAAAPAVANQWNPPYPPSGTSNLKDATSMAQSMVGSVKQTASYPANINGIQHTNIWPGLLGPEMYGLAIAALTPQDPLFVQQDPVYDYCGKLVGYTSTVISGDPNAAGGNPASGAEPNPPQTNFNFMWIDDRKCWTVTGIQSEQIINGRKDTYLDANPKLTFQRGYNHILGIPSLNSVGTDLAPEFYICKVKEDLTPDTSKKFNLGLSRLETYELLEDANGLPGTAGAQRKIDYPMGTTMYFAAGQALYSGKTPPDAPNPTVWWYNIDTTEIKKYVPPDFSDTSTAGGSGGGTGGGSRDVWYFNDTDCVFAPGGFVPGPVTTYPTLEECSNANGGATGVIPTTGPVDDSTSQYSITTDVTTTDTTLPTGTWVAVTDQEQIDSWVGSSTTFNAPHVNYLCYTNEDGSVFGLIEFV